MYRHYCNLRLLGNIGVLDNLSDPSIPSWAYRATRPGEAFSDTSNPHPSKHVNIKFEAGNSIMVVKDQIVDKIETEASPVPFLPISVEGHGNIIPYETRRHILLNFATAMEHLGVSMKSVTTFFRAWICEKSWPASHNDIDAAFYWIQGRI